MLANNVFWRLMLFYTHLLLLLQPSVLWLSIVIFNNDAKQPPKWIFREFDVLQIRPRLSGLLRLETFTWQNLTPAERVTRSGDWRVNVIKLELEVIWKGGLPHLSGLPYLHGVLRFHVKRPLEEWKKKEVYVRVARQKITMAQQEESISFLATSHQILIQPSFY